MEKGKGKKYNTPFLPPEDNNPTEATVFGESVENLKTPPDKKEEAHWYPVLILIKGQESKHRMVISKKETLLGRDPKMDVVISRDVMVSRLHARIQWENFDYAEEYPRCFIEDMKSRNGTFLNRSRLEARAQLSDGDRFLLGSSLFGFYIKDYQELEYDNNLLSMATVDSLTGLVNRRAFLAEAHRTIARAIRYHEPLCLAVLDIDSFKSINDEYGHGAGDAVLRQLSAVMRRVLREGDVMGRMGGDEFAIIMPETRMDEAKAALDRFRDAVAAGPFRMEDLQINATVSIGVAPLTPELNGWKRLYKAADMALYEAKEKGRNRLECAEE